ncbi:hypothetical protein OPT61_g7763 [Boeremia exigua]|uniref:Uncharacterized protein n=1 Tax=Boeremia exigua TaxID=749465 RepID=A0ACC2I187_9PLEO|nr:hypothetical protein OPT61_g7763 [Boeremia exigua]
MLDPGTRKFRTARQRVARDTQQQWRDSGTPHVRSHDGSPGGFSPVPEQIAPGALASIARVAIRMRRGRCPKRVPSVPGVVQEDLWTEQRCQLDFAALKKWCYRVLDTAPPGVPSKRVPKAVHSVKSLASSRNPDSILLHLCILAAL